MATPNKADLRIAAEARRTYTATTGGGSFFSPQHASEPRTPGLKVALRRGLATTGHFKHHTAHKGHEPPKFANSLFASYQGTYAKAYAPSFDGTFRSRSTAAGTFYSGVTVTREVDNQQGTDAQFDEVRPAVHEPIEFTKQRARDVFHKRDGAMRVEAHENRFIPINDTTIVNSKFKKY